MLEKSAKSRMRDSMRASGLCDLGAEECRNGESGRARDFSLDALYCRFSFLWVATGNDGAESLSR